MVWAHVGMVGGLPAPPVALLVGALHEDLLESPLEQVRKVARFLGGRFAAHDDAALERIVDASSFGEMKKRHETEENTSMRNEGEAGHFRKGKAGDWRDHFSEAHTRRFRGTMRARLSGSGLEGRSFRELLASAQEPYSRPPMAERRLKGRFHLRGCSKAPQLERGKENNALFGTPN